MKCGLVATSASFCAACGSTKETAHAGRLDRVYDTCCGAKEMLQPGPLHHACPLLECRGGGQPRGGASKVVD